MQLARKIFPFCAFAVCFAALVYAVSFGTLPKAEFTFNNGDEIKTIDPSKATGAPEGRVINALFEGLYRNRPKGLKIDQDGRITKYPQPGPDGNVPMTLVPAMADSHTVSEDGRTYTFTIRDSARWSDGSPVTADDFLWSWQRMLHPETASRYAYQLTSYVVGAEQYNAAQIDVPDRVEVELSDRPNGNQTFPRGSILRGILRQIARPPQPDVMGLGDDERERKEAEWKKNWVYVIEVKPSGAGGEVHWDAEGELKAFSKNPPEGLADFTFQRAATDGEADEASEAKSSEESASDPGAHLSQVDYTGAPETCRNILPDFDSRVGIKAPDPGTFVVHLKNRTPFFLDLVAFYPLYPVNRRCIEKFGTPGWTKSGNIVSNGPFLLAFRRIRDRVRLVRNPDYWNAKVVEFKIVDALAVKSATTSINMYLNGQLDWTMTVPSPILPDLKKRDDFTATPGLITYFYRLNVNKPPLDDVHVRRALNMAINKQLICDKVGKAGQQPARSFVPPGLDGYRSGKCGAFDPQGAVAELEKSKYHREGKPLPKIKILYNTSEGHRNIAEVIQQQWKNYLGIDVELSNSEWGTFLDMVHQMEYTVARSGWIGDYPDPNTFLDMWVTDGANNETGWSNEEYDQLIFGAAAEPDAARRLEMLQRAEAILMDEQPIVPIYFYVTVNMVQPHIRGFYANIQDLHPLHLLRVAE